MEFMCPMCRKKLEVEYKLRGDFLLNFSHLFGKCYYCKSPVSVVFTIDEETHKPTNVKAFGSDLSYIG